MREVRGAGLTLWMRSVLLHFAEVSHPDLAASIRRWAGPRAGHHWVWPRGDDPFLYIDTYDDYQEYERDEFADLCSRLGGQPSVSIVVGVSGRHVGRREVQAFVIDMLRRHRGLVDDDHGRVWTREELLDDESSGRREFFPYSKLQGFSPDPEPSIPEA